MLNDEEGNAVVVAQAGDLLENLVRQFGRDAGGRLVQKQQLWLAHQAAGDLQQLHLPAGQVRCQRIEVLL